MSNYYEVWKPLVGKFEQYTYYQISNLGRIKSNVYNKHRVLKPGFDKDGYRCASLCHPVLKLIKNAKIHILVAEAFICLCPNNKQVNHKDCNKSNNNISNLEWVSHKKNMCHASKNGLLNYFNKLTQNNIKEIRELYKTNKYTQYELGNKFNVAHQTISHIINFKRSYK